VQVVSERRPTNSELRLSKLEDEEPTRDDRGILELFEEEAAVVPDEDAPLARDDTRE
jgi:hypothetical protein